MSRLCLSKPSLRPHSAEWPSLGPGPTVPGTQSTPSRAILLAGSHILQTCLSVQPQPQTLLRCFWRWGLIRGFRKMRQKERSQETGRNARGCKEMQGGGNVERARCLLDNHRQNHEILSHPLLPVFCAAQSQHWKGFISVLHKRK